MDFNNRYMQIIRKKVLNSQKRKKFCAAVISNNIITDYFRLEFIEELNNINNMWIPNFGRNMDI